LLTWLLEHRKLDAETAAELRLCVSDLLSGMGLASPAPRKHES
jgi:hypothetical protein